MTEDQTQQNQQDLIIIIVSTVIVITIITLIIVFWPVTPAPAPVTPAPAQVTTPPPPQPVTVYTDCDYKGESASFLPGTYDVSHIKIPNDTLSSVKVPVGRSIKIFQHGVNAGNSITLTKDTPCLVSEGFNDTASAWIVS